MVGSLGASCFPVGTTYFDLLTLKSLHLSGTLAAVINGVIGPGFTSTGFFNSSILATNTSPGRTWALICFFTTSPNANTFMDSSSQVNGLICVSGSFSIKINGTTLGGIALTTGVPYFLAGSGYSAIGYNLLALNLRTGVIQTQTGTTTSSFATSGGFISWGTLTGFVYGPCSYTPTYLSMPQLLLWAQRPWDFWYPPTVESLIFDVLSTTAPSGAKATWRTLVGAGI